jgi:hypothetical protein
VDAEAWPTAWRDCGRNARASRITIAGACCGCRRIDNKFSPLILPRDERLAFAGRDILDVAAILIPPSACDRPSHCATAAIGYMMLDIASTTELEMAQAKTISMTRHAFADGSFKQMLIDGKWVDAASGKHFESRNPATGELLASCGRRRRRYQPRRGGGPQGVRRPLAQIQAV